MLTRFPESAVDWLPFLAFWLVLFALVASESFRPLYRDRDDPDGRLPTNLGFGLINASLISLAPVSTMAAAGWAAGHGVGLLNLIAVPTAIACVVTVLVRSLVTYLVHRLSHSIPLLWRVHKVHHCDTVLDLSTGFRHHSLELVVVGLSFAGVAIVFGLSASTLVIYEIVAAAFGLWDHANLRLPARLDRLLRAVLVTPAMHHVHHSAVRAETDSNFGDMLSIWDRLFGTYRYLDDQGLRALRFGLGERHDPDAGRFIAQLLSPLRSEPAPGAAAPQPAE